MTDPGWDIPGVLRAAASDASAPAAVDGSVSSAPGSSASASSGAALSGAALSSPRARSGRRARAGSVSASGGLSAGAFAPLRDGGASAAAWSAGSPGVFADSGTAAFGNDFRSADSRATGSPGTAASSVGCPDAGSACGADSGTGSPGAGPPGVRVSDPVQALAYLGQALEFLAHANPAEWPEGAQADCLRARAVAESMQAAAHARVLAAFSVPGGGAGGGRAPVAAGVADLADRRDPPGRRHQGLLDAPPRRPPGRRGRAG